MANWQKADIEGYNTNGYSCFKLRDMGKSVGVDVDFQYETILITTQIDEHTI